MLQRAHIVQELCESRGGHPGLSVLTSLLVSVDVKIIEPCFGIGHNLSLICQLTSEDIKQHFTITAATCPEDADLSSLITRVGSMTSALHVYLWIEVTCRVIQICYGHDWCTRENEILGRRRLSSQVVWHKQCLIVEHFWGPNSHEEPKTTELLEENVTHCVCCLPRLWCGGECSTGKRWNGWYEDHTRCRPRIFICFWLSFVVFVYDHFHCLTVKCSCFNLKKGITPKFACCVSF